LATSVTIETTVVGRLNDAPCQLLLNFVITTWESNWWFVDL